MYAKDHKPSWIWLARFFLFHEVPCAPIKTKLKPCLDLSILPNMEAEFGLWFSRAIPLPRRLLGMLLSSGSCWSRDGSLFFTLSESRRNLKEMPHRREDWNRRGKVSYSGYKRQVRGWKRAFTIHEVKNGSFGNAEPKSGTYSMRSLEPLLLRIRSHCS